MKTLVIAPWSRAQTRTDGIRQALSGAPFGPSACGIDGISMRRRVPFALACVITALTLTCAPSAAQEADTLRAPVRLPVVLVSPFDGTGPLPDPLVEPHTLLDLAENDEVFVSTVWESDLAAQFNISQASFHNWTGGGVNTLASSAQILSKLVRTSQNWSGIYETRLGFGVVKQDTLNLRKADDVIRLLATVKYHGQGFFRKFNPTASAGLRTQFAPGFNYERNPFGDGRPLPVKVSDLLSPATFTQSLGLTYAGAWGFRQRVGVASKETVVLIEGFRSLYGVPPGKPIRFQLGVESLTEVDREIVRNVELKSSLGFFAAFNQEELPDMLWENVVVMRVNKWLSADFEFVTLFDRDLSDRVQLKESLSIGFSFVFI